MPPEMKFLKGLALFILGFLLFWSLFIFGIAFTLNQTILNPDFAISQVNRLDITSIAGDMLKEQVPKEMEQFTGKVVDDTIADLKPWLKEQTGDVIYSFYDYLEGRSQSLSLIISLEPVKESLIENTRQAIAESPPPELQGLPPGATELFLDEADRQIDEQIPATFDVGQALLKPEVMAQLEQAKLVIGYFNLGYNALIGFILLLILLIIVVNRQVRGSTRQIGINFLICGALSYAGVFITKNVAGPQLAQPGMPAYLQTWMPQLLADTLVPLEMFSIGLLAAGVVLLVVSFVYKPRQPSP